jgi:F-type H+-transporting ATPase subunit epsilon
MLALQVVSPERILVDEQVSEVQVPGAEGYMGILPGHAPLLSELMAGGVLSYKSSAGEKVLAVYGGFVEVLPENVRVLADAAERKEEINAEQARAALSKADPNDRGAVMRAQARVDAASK